MDDGDMGYIVPLSAPMRKGECALDCYQYAPVVQRIEQARPKG